MADNVTLPTGVGGDSVAADDIGGVKFQRIKLIHGADGVSAGDVSTANPYPMAISQNTPGTTNGVQIAALTYPQSSGNNSTTQLTTGATFTGAIETVMSLQAAQVQVVCDTAYTVNIDQFIDAAGLKLSSTYTFVRLAGVPTNENITLPGNFMRVRVTNNGAATTTTFQLDTTFGIMNTQPNTLSQLGNFRVVAQENGVVSVGNSTTANLGLSGVFTGAWEDTSEFSTLMISVFSSHVSATDGLTVQQSSDGVNPDITDSYSIPATTGKTFSFGVAARFYRLVYTNGETATSSLRIQTLFSRTPKKFSSVRPQDGRSNDNDFEEGLSYLMGYNGTSWDRLRSTTANGLVVSGLDSVASGSIAAPSQSVAIALNGQSGIALQITGTWVGTLQFEGTVDGTIWVVVNGVIAGTSTPGTTTTTNGVVRLTPSGLAQLRVFSSLWTSGTAVISLRASAATGGTFLNQSLTAGTNIIGKTGIDQTTPGTTNLVALTAETTKVIGTVNPPAITKGTQGTVGFTVQSLNDAGRNWITFYSVIPVLATATDTLQSLTGTKSGATVTATTTPAVVTAGKTLRITRMSATYVATATSGYAIARLRFNPAGVVAIGSPIAATLAVGAGTPATANSAASEDASIPDGVEFAASTGIGISVQGFSAATATAVGYMFVTVSGYEY